MRPIRTRPVSDTLIPFPFAFHMQANLPSDNQEAQTIPAIHKITTTGQIVNCTAVPSLSTRVIMTANIPKPLCIRDAQPFSKAINLDSPLSLFFDGVQRGVKQRSPPKQNTGHSHHHVLLCTHADVDLLSGWKVYGDAIFSAQKGKKSRFPYCRYSLVSLR